MKILGTLLAMVATVIAQNFGPVHPLAEQPQYAPVQPLIPFNVAPDGFYGYNPYTNGVGLGPQQVPPMIPAYNNFAHLPYQFPVAYPHPAYPNPAYPQYPVFPQFPQLFPQQLQQLPSPFQPALHPAFPQQIIQHSAPQPNAAAVLYNNYQTQLPPQQPLTPAIAQVQGVNGLTKPVTTPFGSGNQAYGSAFGKYVAVPASTSNKSARYEAVSGSTVHTATLPGHEMDYKVVSGQQDAAAATTVPGMQ
ncbi:uncharacterized protein LOC135705818 [Ochlerotatus camptorhynchus]|uniref:uncharacterized protein LOC135705818 n=1 Tax=Ochlerotatus camptorhynchus TaxID=644619 RepID=UPI0031D5FA0A